MRVRRVARDGLCYHFCPFWQPTAQWKRLDYINKIVLLLPEGSFFGRNVFFTKECYSKIFYQIC